MQKPPIPTPTLVDAAGGDEGAFAALAALVRYRELVRNLVFKDLKLKYRGSFFGFLWSLLNPLVVMTVYTVAFKYIMPLRTGGFVFLLLLGILAWSFFRPATMGAAAIVDNGGLKTVHPRAVLLTAPVPSTCAVPADDRCLPPVLLVVYQAAACRDAALPIFVLLQLAMTTGIALGSPRASPSATSATSRSR